MTPSPSDTLWPTFPVLERNAFWHGKLMGVQEFQREQEYFRALQQRLTCLTVGSGVLCGLGVARHGPAGIAVEAGAAVDGSGRLVTVGYDVCLQDVGPWICADGGPGSAAAPGWYAVCLVYHECPSAPAPALVTGCETRMECRPGAVEERYRIELRPVERPGCEPLCPEPAWALGPGRPCPCGQVPCACSPAAGCTTGGDCVVLAGLEWDGSAVTALSLEGRTEIASNRVLTGWTGAGWRDPTAIGSPRLVGMWPAPGSVLDRQGSPSEWARWRYRPRLELTFDRPIAVDRIDDPGDWLRAWIVVGAGEGGTRCHRLGLEYLAGVDGKAGGGHTLVFALEHAPVAAALAGPAGGGVRIVVQAVADDDTGPVNAGPVTRPAQLAYAGTTLGRSELANLWHRDVCPPTAAIDPATLPPCVGDGYEGGHLHASFTIGPVDPEPAVTAVFPFNGARVTGRALPALEVSGTVEPLGLAPRAWLFTGGTAAPLALEAGAALPAGDRPQALARFQGALDDSVIGELSGTVRFAVRWAGALPPSGRVLVVAPAIDDDGGGPRSGGFAGTCLTDAAVARIYQHGPTAEDGAGLRPSELRLPRAGAAGHWIHWTFAWEHADDVIN